MKKSLRDSKGITLIALIVTIVVILILSAIIIRTSIGDNGLIDKAQGAADTYEDVAKDEIEKSAEVDEIIKRRQTTTDEIALNPASDSIFIFDADTNSITGIKDQYLKYTTSGTGTDYIKVDIVDEYANKLVVPNQIDGVAVKNVRLYPLENVQNLEFQEGIENVTQDKTNTFAQLWWESVRNIILPTSIKSVDIPAASYDPSAGTYYATMYRTIPIRYRGNSAQWNSVSVKIHPYYSGFYTVTYDYTD